MARHPIKRAPRPVDAGERIAGVVRELRGHRLLRLDRRESQVFEIGQPLGAFGQLLVFAALRRRRLDLVHGEPQFLGLAGAAIAFGDQHVELALLRLPPAEDLLIVTECGRELRPGEAIERLALRGRRAQPDLLRLPVHDDELLADLAEHADGSCASADGGAAAALARHRAAQDELRPSVR